MSSLKGKDYKRFEDIKHIREDGSEYWSARELAPVLEYAKWDTFHKVIKRAMIACENAGHSILDQFPEVGNLVVGGVAPREKVDYELTRYACYLIVQNGDPRKEVIALGQTYPEDLPTPEKSIQQIEKEQMERLQKKAKAGKLMLDE